MISKFSAHLAYFINLKPKYKTHSSYFLTNNTEQELNFRGKRSKTKQKSKTDFVQLKILILE